MNRHYQKITNKNKAEGEITDNFQAAMNTLLNRSDFPDLRQSEDWTRGLEDYLNTHNYYFANVFLEDEVIPEEYKGVDGLFLALLNKQTPGDTHAVVVDRDLNVIHNPDPDYLGYGITQVWVIQKKVELDYFAN